MSNISSSKTTEQENEVLAHRFHMEIFQKAKFSLADEILTPNFVIHNPILPSELTKGPEGVRNLHRE
jgi:predicted SnoaL-like aldol condensation-catalyzing enzyme